MAEQSKLKKAEDADNRRKDFIAANTGSNIVRMKCLYKIDKHKDYKDLGFETFKDYFGAPTESGGLGVSYAWAIQLVKVYAKYVKEMKMPEQIVGQLGTRKLYALLNEKLSEKEIVDTCQNSTLQDIQLNKKGIDINKCKHDWQQFRRCKNCKIWEQVN